MKTKLFCCCISLALNVQVVQAETIASDSKIQKVIAYRNGAYITRTGEVDIPAGPGTVIIEGYSDRIDPSSVRIHSLGNFEILSIQHQYDYRLSNKQTEALSTLNEKRDFTGKQVNELKLIKEVLVEEMKLLKSDKLISKRNTEFSIKEMTSVMDFFRKRLKNIKLSILENEQKLNALEKELYTINTQINQFEQKRRRVSQFVIKTYSRRALNSKIELSYWTDNATWTSNYDIKANQIKDPLIIQSNASLTNSTGEDWEEVDLILSTGNPWKSMRIPTVSPWWIDFTNPYPSIHLPTMEGYAVDEVLDSEPRNTQQKPEFQYEYPDLPVTIVSENFTTREYKIAGQRTLRSNNLPHKIKMLTNEVHATFQHVAVPAKSTYAFLKVTIPDWEKYFFSKGTASLFFEGTYIGNTFLNPQHASDSMDISFGPDMAVFVSRTKSKDYSAKKWFGTKKIENVEFTFDIRNNKGSSIDIQILDQLPISSNEAIEVGNVEIGKAQINKGTGILTWNTTIQPGKTFSDQFSYVVTFPKGKVLASR